MYFVQNYTKFLISKQNVCNKSYLQGFSSQTPFKDFCFKQGTRQTCVLYNKLL